MRVAIGLLVLACGCDKTDETFWRDRPDVLVKGEVAGHPYTIQMPRNHAIERTAEYETFSIDQKPLVTIEWTTPAAATERVMKAAGKRLEIEKLGLDGAPAPDLVVEDIHAVNEITLELAGPKLGFVTNLESVARHEVFAFLPSGLADGGFTCTSMEFADSYGAAEVKKNLDRIRGVCLSLRTATKGAPSSAK
jgi:hypothetical protein